MPKDHVVSILYCAKCEQRMEWIPAAVAYKHVTPPSESDFHRATSYYRAHD